MDFTWGQSWLFIVRNKMNNIKESRLTIILRSHCAKIVPKNSANKCPFFQTSRRTPEASSPIFNLTPLVGGQAGSFSYSCVLQSRSSVPSSFETLHHRVRWNPPTNPALLWFLQWKKTNHAFLYQCADKPARVHSRVSYFQPPIIPLSINYPSSTPWNY